ncbi:MAG TPA: Crp/Fnr family transcriptional regulator [Mycobacteriales bacterium]|nr:Crp/Fnr family transcriptional regulator [Mycobacteriales bacterium]
MDERRLGYSGVFWSLLNDEQREAVSAAATVRRFPPNTVLVREGDHSRSVYVLTSGQVKVMSAGPGGHDAVLALLSPGHIIGEMAAIDSMPRSATARSVDEVTALWLSEQAFAGLLRDQPGIVAVVLKIMTARLRYANLRRTEYGDSPAPARLAALLVELADRYGTATPDGTLIRLQLSQHDLAGLVAASPVAVTRALKALRDQHVISTGRQRVVIHQLDVLRTLAAPPS